MRRIEPYFPLSHGIARDDDRRVISGFHVDYASGGALLSAAFVVPCGPLLCGINGSGVGGG